jgi:hypothetical protein
MRPIHLSLALIALAFSACSSRQPQLLAVSPTPAGVIGKVPTANSPVGIWSGSDGEQKITLKFAEGGKLIFTSAAGAEAGTWIKAGSGIIKLATGEYRGQLTMLDSRSASLTMEGTTIEVSRQ